MKNKLIILWMAILTMFTINSLQASMPSEPIYKIDKEQAKVYFGYVEITEADINTFTVLDDYFYAKDKNHVYFGKEILNFIDPVEVIHIGYGRIKDNKHVYIGNKIIANADPTTYQVLAEKESQYYHTPFLNNQYSKDKNNVYFLSKIIVSADSDSFMQLNNYLGKDKNHIYLNDNILDNADVETFKVLNVESSIEIYDEKEQGYGYATDKNHVYFLGEVISGADPKSFKERTYGYAEDKNYIYYLRNIVEDADPKTFIQPNFERIIF